MKFPKLLFRIVLAVAFANASSGEVALEKKHTAVYGSSGCDFSGSRSLYVFQNGMGFGTPREEAEVLLGLGYCGVSQLSGDARQIQKSFAAYRGEGLLIGSVYLDASGESLDGKDAEKISRAHPMIELTVKKMDAGTVERIRKTCGTAQGMNMKVALYPHHGYAVATMPQAMELIAKVNHGNLGVMFNLCHFLRGEDVADLEKVITNAGDRLFAVSVSGAEVGGKGWDALIKPLDEGDFPMERLIKVLEETGFHGPVSLQCYGVPGDKKKNLERSMAAWKKLNGKITSQ